MAAMRLNTRAELWALRGDPPAPLRLRDLWCEVRTIKTTADVPPASGLRSAVPYTIACRDEVDARPGQYLAVGARLWILDSRRDLPAERGRLLTATELLGEPAMLTPAGGPPVTPLRAALLRSAAALGEFGGGVERRAHVEVCAFEIPALAAGDRIAVAGADWIVIEPVPESWDGVTYQAWVQPA